MDRTKGIGASDAAATMGLSRWKTPMQLYLEKIGEAAELEPTTAMRIGTRLEQLVLDMFEETIDEGSLHRGRHPIPDPCAAWRWASLDAEHVHEGSQDPTDVVEAKTSSDSWEWGRPGTDQIPTDYLVQAQHQLLVTDLWTVWVPVLFLNTKAFEIYRVDRDEEFIETLDAAETAFWQSVQERRPPAVTAKDLPYLKRARRGLDGPTADANEFQEADKLIHFAAKATMKAMQDDADESLARILEDMRASEVSTLVFQDGSKLRRKEVKRKEYTVAAQTIIDTRWIKAKEPK